MTEDRQRIRDRAADGVATRWECVVRPDHTGFSPANRGSNLTRAEQARARRARKRRELRV